MKTNEKRFGTRVEGYSNRKRVIYEKKTGVIIMDFPISSRGFDTQINQYKEF